MIVDDDLLHFGRKFGDRLVDDAEEKRLVENARGAVEEVRKIDGDEAETAVVDRAFPEFVDAVLVAEAGDERPQLVHRLDGVAVERNAVLDFADGKRNLTRSREATKMVGAGGSCLRAFV